MSTRTCLSCDEEKPEDGGEVIEETDETRRMGIPTGFVCGDCIDDAPEWEGPETPLDLSSCGSAEDAARTLYEFLQDYAAEMDMNPGAIQLYPPDAAAKRRDGHANWTVAWEGGPYEWATQLTSEESMFRAELNRPFGTEPQVVGFYSNTGWTAEPYYSFDIQFVDN